MIDKLKYWIYDTKISRTFSYQYRQLFDVLSDTEVNEMIENRSIYLDINVRKILKNSNTISEMTFEVKKWLPIWLQIKNPDALISFCRMHWFLPIISWIYIEWKDVSKTKELNNLNQFFILSVLDWNINYAIYWEINKILYSLRKLWLTDYDVSDLYYLLWVFESIKKVWFNDLIRSFWPWLKKFNNEWALSENIFTEIASRLENNIRWVFDIYSTYISLASAREDSVDKIDMWWLTRSKNNSRSRYRKYPIQLTISDLENNWYNEHNWKPTYTKKKIDNIEKMLFSNWSITLPFIVLSVWWEFKEIFTRWEIQSIYKDWLSSNNIREKQSQNEFPYFIDTVSSDILQSPSVCYILINLLFKHIRFKKSFKNHSDLNTFKYFKENEINNILLSKKDTFIWNINLWSISIKIANIKKVKNPNPKSNLKYLMYYEIYFFYDWLKLGWSRVYL